MKMCFSLLICLLLLLERNLISGQGELLYNMKVSPSYTLCLLPQHYSILICYFLASLLNLGIQKIIFWLYHSVPVILSTVYL